MGKRERSVCPGRMGVGEESFFMLLKREVLVSLQKRLKLILCSVGDLEAFKIFVVCISFT